MHAGICVKSREKKWYFDYEIDAMSIELKASEINTWRALSCSEISGDNHFRCLWLSKCSNDGPLIMDSITETVATVVVVINSIDSFQVEEWVYTSLPVIVLCSSAGEILQQIFDNSLGTEVTAMISHVSMDVEKDAYRKSCIIMVVHRMARQPDLYNTSL